MFRAFINFVTGNKGTQTPHPITQSLPTIQRYEEKPNSPKTRDELLTEGNYFITSIGSAAPEYDRDRIKAPYTQTLYSTPDNELAAYVSTLQRTLWDMSDLRKALMDEKLKAGQLHRKLDKIYYKTLQDEVWEKLSTYQLSYESLEDFKKANLEFDRKRRELLSKELNRLLPLWTPRGEQAKDKEDFQAKVKNIFDVTTDLNELEFAVTWIEISIKNQTKAVETPSLSNHPSALLTVKSPKEAVAKVDTTTCTVDPKIRPVSPH